jgi:hypothetical protein
MHMYRMCGPAFHAAYTTPSAAFTKALRCAQAVAVAALKDKKVCVCVLAKREEYIIVGRAASLHIV